ncbi:swr1 complex component [Coemansia sp. RSA 2167]|nr:swr1 complex component [Coemansia sp. RSA 2167]KAJ2154219.1 swr1 complex component [Coemansia sp. RSA 637]KAJ2536755.1 swr1 complex component [Coemansia sp. RSA 1935]
MVEPSGINGRARRRGRPPGARARVVATSNGTAHTDRGAVGRSEPSSEPVRGRRRGRPPTRHRPPARSTTPSTPTLEQPPALEQLPSTPGPLPVIDPQIFARRAMPATYEQHEQLSQYLQSTLTLPDDTNVSSLPQLVQPKQKRGTMSVPVPRDHTADTTREEREKLMQSTVSEWVHDTATKMHRIAQLRLRGMLRDTQATVCALPPAQREPVRVREPPPGPSLWSQLLVDVVDRYRELTTQRRHRLVVARKQAIRVRRECELRMRARGEFRHTKDKERAELAGQKRRAKWAMQQVMRKWAYVEMVVEEQRREEEDEERREEEKKVLFDMLQQSTQLLEEQRAKDSEGSESEESDVESESGQKSESEVFSSESESEDEMDGLARDQDEDMATLVERYQHMHSDEPRDVEMTDRVADTPDNQSEAIAVEQPDEPESYSVEQPSLLRGGQLRAYQRQGLDWLAGLHSQGTNGILADEMGLGKTIQTLALFAHLAIHGIWGPHLIIVPTSVLLNWEQELHKWVPGLKVLSYFGSRDDRKLKRRGWSQRNAFHVCITSYQLAIQDSSVFRRKQWHYMVLDEAQAIKNFRSQRWQTLLGFKTEHRLLLTGTPLQNNLMELWSLLYFLMPHGFAEMDKFREWFSQPLEKLLQGPDASSEADARSAVTKLHTVLRPYMLRRLKCNVERQMPRKVEHVVRCALSKRQRYLYDDFMQRAQTQSTLRGGSYVGVMGVLMQLRKVCNHPDLFETRPIVTSWAVSNACVAQFGVIEHIVRRMLGSKLCLDRLLFVHEMAGQAMSRLDATLWIERRGMQEAMEVVATEEKSWSELELRPISSRYRCVASMQKVEAMQKAQRSANVWLRLAELNKLRMRAVRTCGAIAFQNIVDVPSLLVQTVRQRVRSLGPVLERFVCVTPSIVAINTQADRERVYPHLKHTSLLTIVETKRRARSVQFLRAIESRQQMSFPEPFLVQYDCGKLQALSRLLHDLVPQGHRVLIFTQMTRVLDILERWLNLHGLRYLRLDGATRVEQRWRLTEMFNHDPRYSVFISSTRAGGLGINLTGADTVVFYDSDWNHAMDAQCQDRCHRIGQQREVHVYRLIGTNTVEEAIWRKQQEKRWLDKVVIEQGRFDAKGEAELAVGDWYDLAASVLQSSDKDCDVTRRDVSDREAGRARMAAEDEADARALHVASTEVARADALDQGVDSDAATPAPTPDEPTPKPVEDHETDDVETDNIGHIDDYMLRFITTT